MTTFVFDVDGTLSFNGRVIAPEILTAIADLQEQGHRVIFASARPIRDLLPIILGFTNNLLIGANGALISQQQQIQAVAPIPDSGLRLLKQFIQQYDCGYVVDGQWDYAARVAADAPIRRQLDPQQLAQQRPLAAITPAIKVILLNLPAQTLPALATKLTAAGLEVVQHTGEGNLDVMAKRINKATTLASLGITDYVAFGNDQNDLAMLAQAKTSVWVTSKPALCDYEQLATTVCAPANAVVAQQIRSFTASN